MQNQYLKIEHMDFDSKISAELFRKLFDLIRRPLQIMTDSDNLPLIAFITEGGFVCKRKCYEVEASLQNYIGKVRMSNILQTRKGNLPDCVFYQKEDDTVCCFAFVEENEIAYVYSRNEGNFVPFAETLVNRLLTEYQTICFEADDEIFTVKKTDEIRM